MISHLSGILLSLQPPSLILEVHGVGYDVEVPQRVLEQLPALGSALQLHTHLVVREDAHLLYGFLAASDRALFRQLLKVSGVGAKLALALLGYYDAAQLIDLVLRQDKVALGKVSGVGKKTAERLVLELADKLTPLANVSPPTPHDVRVDVGAALQTLGYSEKEIQAAVRTLDPSVELSRGIKEALQWLAQLR